MNSTMSDRGWRGRLVWVLLLGVWAGLVGCRSTKAAPEANAERAANTGDALASSAKKKCPGAAAEIAAAESAGAAARAASKNVEAKANARSDARAKLRDAQRTADQSSSEEGRLSKTLKAEQEAYKKADADYIKADEEYDSYRAQAAAAGLDTTDANLNGTLDRIRAGAEVPLALANAANAKARRDSFRAQHNANKTRYEPRIKELEGFYKQAKATSLANERVLETAKANEKKADADFSAALDDLNQKTKASRAANAALAKACPDAEAEVYPQGARVPGSQPPGLDVFGGTTSQHQEP